MYESTDNMVSHPNHYQSKCGFEVIDVIEEYTRELFGITATDTGNVIKYICRWKQKNGIQDLEKAIWYATHLKERWEQVIHLGIRCYIPKYSLKEVVEAFTDGLDIEERNLTSRAITLACDWWTYNSAEAKLEEFIDIIHELIDYEKEKENK